MLPSHELVLPLASMRVSPSACMKLMWWRLEQLFHTYGAYMKVSLWGLGQSSSVAHNVQTIMVMPPVVVADSASSRVCGEVAGALVVEESGSAVAAVVPAVVDATTAGVVVFVLTAGVVVAVVADNASSRACGLVAGAV